MCERWTKCYTKCVRVWLNCKPHIAKTTIHNTHTYNAHKMPVEEAVSVILAPMLGTYRVFATTGLVAVHRSTWCS
jgi:hypothetical protein